MSKAGKTIASFLRSVCGLALANEDAFVPQRTYAGRHQLSAGAWRWFLARKREGQLRPDLLDDDHRLSVGSHSTATDVARAICEGRAAVGEANAWGEYSIDVYASADDERLDKYTWRARA